MMITMKAIPGLVRALALGTALLAAAIPMAAQAAMQADGLRIGLGVGLLIGQQDDDRRHRRDDDRRGGDRDNGGYGRRGGDGQRDDRINRAIAIAQSRGRVLDAWPEGGSLFGVRVATSHGRVDLTIDVDSGRIIDER